MTHQASNRRLITNWNWEDATSFVLVSLLTISFLSASPVDAKKARRRSSGATSGGGGGPHGLVLQTPPPRNPMEHNNRGVELGSKGLWTDAIREHEEALNADPENTTFRQNLSSAHLHYADLLRSKKKLYEAINHYREALYADPANMPADAHLDDCLKSIGKNADDFNVRSGIADENDASGNYVVAIVEYRKCVKMRDDGLSRFRLARVLYKQGKVVESYEELRTAINKEWKPTEQNELSNCHCLMGDILWEVTLKAKEQGRGPLYMKRLFNVGVCYRRAATINPNNADAIRGLINASKEAIAITDSFDNTLMIAGAYTLGADFERAKQHFNKCWQLGPNNPALHKARIAYHLAVVTSAISTPKLLQESVLKIEKELEKRPDDAELLYIYGRGEEALKNNDLAIRAYEKARSINPHVNPDLMQGLNRLTGAPVEVASKPGLGAQGAVGGKPGQPGTPGQAGQPAAQGAGGAAGQKVAEAPKVDPNAPEPSLVGEAAYAAIEAKISQGDKDGAKAELTAIIDKYPKEGRAYLLLGSIQEAQGETASATVNYRMANSFKAVGAADALRQIDITRVNGLMISAKESISKGDSVSAASTLKQVIRLAPELPEPHKLLGEALDKMGDKKEAERERKKADELQKKDL